MVNVELWRFFEVVIDNSSGHLYSSQYLPYYLLISDAFLVQRDGEAMTNQNWFNSAGFHFCGFSFYKLVNLVGFTFDKLVNSV